MRTIIRLLSVLTLALLLVPAPAADTNEAKGVTLQAGSDGSNARLTIEAFINGLMGDKAKPICASAIQETVRVLPDRIAYSVQVKFEVLQGNPSELTLALGGAGEIRQVTGEGLQDWGVRQESGGARLLSLRLVKQDKAITQFTATIAAECLLDAVPANPAALTFVSQQPALSSGFVKIETAPEVSVRLEKPTGLVPMDPEYLPEPMRPAGDAARETLAFRFDGAAYSAGLAVTPADPEDRRVVLKGFKLVGDLRDDHARFTLNALARVRDPQGGKLPLLWGAVALTETPDNPAWRLRLENGQFVLIFDQPGDYPVQVSFHAAVQRNAGGSQNWQAVDFKVAPTALQPIFLRGLAANTEFEFAGAARPERSGDEFVSFLPADGSVKLSWKAARPETEGKLFFSAEMLSQIGIGPGLMRQVALIDVKVMQGELSRVNLVLQGAGEVTRVQGEQVLSWSVAPAAGSSNRVLEVQFNQPQKTTFSLQVQMQTPLGAFPQTVEAMQVRPEGATRFAGYLRVVNDGAVRLEVVEARRLSQISPEQFPENNATKAALRAEGRQRFAYRFSGADFGLRIQADQILPELAVSEVLAYNLGENELAIEGEFELDIREAPLRELQISIPKGYAVARLTAGGLSDYFLREPEGQTGAELRLVFGQPVAGRMVVQLRLERNQALGETSWTLPRIEIARVKSVRGHVGVTADAGFRVTPEKTQGLTEIATAFFPRKLARIQSAFRLSEASWQAALRVERLPQTVQADVFHLFSIGEGIAYGSSVMTYVISGAPISSFKVELSGEYANVEFTGKDIRNWQKTETGYVVQLHTPVSGSYTLLASYERPFKAQGETLAFAGARPVDAQSEQGHTIVISAYQFQVKPVNVSAGLLPLETREVPPEYRLFFDAPILAAYRYTSRPFNLQLALSPLVQGDSLSQVVDRASLSTRIDKEGQVLTDALYFVKNRGNPHLRVTLPAGTRLWSATVDGKAVVPVIDGNASLVPLPQHTDPNSVLALELKLASRSERADRVKIAAPVLAAPVLLAKWDLTPDTGKRLVFRQGSLTPVGGAGDYSGFGALARAFEAAPGPSAGMALAAVCLAALAMLVWRWTCQEGVYRFSSRHIFGLLVGGIACVLAIVALVGLGDLIGKQNARAPHTVTMLAPVQQAGSELTVEVANLKSEVSFARSVASAWPAILALGLWAYLWITNPAGKRFGVVVGWVLLAWAALRSPGATGAIAFLAVVGAFLLLEIAVPALRRLWNSPIEPAASPLPPGAGGAVSTAAILLVLGCLSLKAGAATPKTRADLAPPLAQAVVQEIRAEDDYAQATARLRWQAIKGQMLPVLYDPGVLTRISFPSNTVKLVQAPAGPRQAQYLFATESGLVEVELRYQVRLTKKDGETGFPLPTQHGLVNRLSLTVANSDVEVRSPHAVSVDRQSAGSNTLATVVLSPANDAWVAWRPRTRDVRREKAVFYAELSQLYVPAAGVIEGSHHVFIRPAQGEISELVFRVPPGATVTDVLDPATAAPPADAAQKVQPIVSGWRFDPDTRKLYVNLGPGQSKPFALLVRSQMAVGPLPFEQSAGLLAVDGAAGQIGLLGVGTGSEVSLDAVTAEGCSPINLEDFPPAPVAPLQAQIPGLTVRRAFRYADPGATAVIKASPVEPDVRVESQDTVSLGEDRVVLAAKASVEITRAGIFRLSFLMPAGYDVEAISGEALSHWTELTTPEGKSITLHLKGRTEGKQQFDISVAGPGVKSRQNWPVPQIVLREAGKQRGTILLVPEQGMRLQVNARDNLTQLDPEKSGVRQKGVLAFRVLQSPWKLTLDIEQVDAWVQVTSLQHASVSEAAAKVTANLQYQIENTGLKAFRLLVPTNAESVRFQGEQVADSLPVAGTVTNGMQAWEVKLHRRVIGAFFLQLTYQVMLPQMAPEIQVRGVQALDVNLQRGFVTVQSAGRLQVRVDAAPQALQATEWQSIPRALQRDLSGAAANYAFRLVEPSFALALKLERHEAAQLLPARVTEIVFNSAVADNGTVLTHARIELLPGDKRLLRLTLPKGAVFWFAFVNQNGVWPWREEDRILLPLEQQSRVDRTNTVDLYYSAAAGKGSRRSLDLQLIAPKFDLPLENISWQVSLSEKWHVKDWTGSLQLQQEQFAGQREAVDLQAYFQKEASWLRERSKDAEVLLAQGNEALTKGDPQMARRAFQAAYGLSSHDAAFNEDARVQLHNIKLQQALVGLNVRQAATAGEPGALGGKVRESRGQKEVQYTQQDAKDLLERNTAADNAAMVKLAERIIQQQDAAVVSPAAIRANIPDQGRVLTFKRSVMIDTDADLRIGLEAVASGAAPWGRRFLILGGTLLLLGLFAWAAAAFRRASS